MHRYLPPTDPNPITYRMFEDIRSLLRHGGIYLIGNVLNRVGAFLLLPLYTQHLAVAEYGVLEILYSTVAVISVALGAGLSHTTLRFYFDYVEQSDRHAVVTTNFVTIMTFGIAGALVVHVLREPLSMLLFNSVQYGKALDICLAIMVMDMSVEVGFAYLRAREKSLLYVWLSFARLLIQLCLSVYLVAGQHLGIIGVLTANLASITLAWIAVTGYIVWQCGLTFRTSMVTAMLRYSLPMAGGAVLGVVSLNADRFLLKELISLEAVGLYALAMKFAMLLTFLVSEPFYRAYGPFRFSILHQANAAQLQAVVLHYIVAGASIVGLGVALFMPEVLFLMTPSAYQSAYQYTPILLAATVVATASYCFETGILVKKQTKFLLYFACANLAVKVILNLALIPILGVFGAALAYLFTGLMQTYLINRTSQRLFPVSYPYGAMWRIALIVGVTYVASLGIDYRHWEQSIPLKLGLVAACLGALYLLDKEVKHAVSLALSRIRPGRSS